MRKFDISVTDAAPDSTDGSAYQTTDAGAPRAYQTTDETGPGRAYQSTDGSVNRAQRSAPTEPAKRSD